MCKSAWRVGTVLLFLAFFVSMAAADNDSPPWNWSSYTGPSQWKVAVTEIDSGCGGAVSNDQVIASIQFNDGTAVMGDVGHGPASGSFVSNNILHIPARTVADPPGKSALSAYDVFFTTDCSAFAAKYSWDYTGSDGDCSGTTSLAGTNTQGCPVPTLTPPLTQTPTGYFDSGIGAAHTDLANDLAFRDLMAAKENDIAQYTQSNVGYSGAEPGYISEERTEVAEEDAQIQAAESKIEKEYDAILSRDPGNFQANWDLAQLKKSQGNWDEFFSDMNKALDNKDISLSTQLQIKSAIANSLGLSEYPTDTNSNFIHRLNVDGNAVQAVYGINTQNQPATDPAVEPLKLFALFSKGSDAVTTVTVGNPQGGQ